MAAPSPTGVPAKTAAAEWVDGEGFAAAHADVLTDPNLQFAFEPFDPPEPPAWLDPLGDFFEAIAPYLTYVFWGGVIIIAALILYFIGSEIVRRLPRRRPAPDEAAAAPREYRPAVAKARALLEEADRLAAEGRFGEAARVLLHRSIEDLERAFALAIGPGLTSREIAALKPLSPRGRGVFSEIALAVETSLFGGRQLSADEFARCRQSYAAFALEGGR